QCDLDLERAARGPRERTHLLESVHNADVDVPPVRVGGDQTHGSLARASDDDGDPFERPGLLLRTAQVEVLPLEVEHLSVPERPDDLERLPESAETGLWLG